MPAEVISLLSSPSVGPSSLHLAPPPSRSAQPAAVDAATAPKFDDDDVYDLTIGSPESFRHPTSRTELSKSTLSPRPISGAKRSRDERSAISAAVFYNSDDFDSTINLDSSYPLGDGSNDETREHKKPRLSPTQNVGSGTREKPLSTTDQSGRPPVKEFSGLRKAQVRNDPIEFSSSPDLSKQPNTNGTTGVTLVSTDFLITSSPTSAQPVPGRQSPPTAKPAAIATATSRINYDLSSDDPFASSPQAPRKKPLEPCTIILDDEDDDDQDPFASSPRQASKDTFQASTTNPSNGTLAKGKQRAESPKRRANWDPISSSAPELPRRNDPFDSSPPSLRRNLTKAVSAVIDLSDFEDDSVPRDVEIDSDEEFPDLDNFNVTKVKARLDTKSASALRGPARTTTKSTSARGTTKKSADDRTREKEARAAEREREKERKKQEKEAAKEQKARDKERAAALAEVNKVRTDKKVSTPEMIADLPTSLPAAVILQIQTLLKDLDVQHNSWDSPVDNVVKWRRKVASRFNEELGLWEPIPRRIEPDKYALVIVTASEFVKYALGPEGNDLEAHVLKMKRHFPHEQLIYLIEGLTPWMKKNRNVRNRQFVSAVRSQAEDPAEGGAQPRRRKNHQPQEYIDEDSVEDALLQLQVMHNVLIHHTNASIETAQWVAIFTQHISTVPYRKQREATNAAGAGFCMETGQVRTGEDVKDTYVRMLQEIVRVTAPAAYGIAAEFGTVKELVKGFEERGPLCLENCRKSTNKDGGFSDRSIGKALSKRIYKVFTGQDEWSTDV
ncbi:Crossover junction endonuclease eme1 [Colletotrichum chlorophyti]|uniref:Crossover junction endonuclease eme1 n=1 Tax=Colletotrichum chlorophyti TaxID=708187 RepID=A0A1Q8RXW6_9PEZI|nr:Crossover junction endonuclease eme1 [Colletotrichum chlorophyti]